MRTIHADELSDLALFARVVEDRSFTSAAASMGMSKSALSERIARLEKRAGVRLLHRTTRKVTLTDAGAALYPSCARLVAGAADAERALVSLDDVERDVRGTVRMTADTNLSKTVVPRAVAALADEHPALRVELVADDAFVDVVHGGYDLVLRMARKLDAGVVGRKLASSEEWVVASPTYLARHGTPKTPVDLVRHQCLRYRFREPKTEWRFVTSRGVRSVDVNGPFVANMDAPLVEAALAGLGVAVMARSTVQEHIESGALVRVLAEHPLPPVGVWALHPWRRRPPPRVRAVVDAIAAEIKRSGRFARP
jgi:DNA-binding transcriptional LysR family regulator